MFKKSKLVVALLTLSTVSAFAATTASTQHGIDRSAVGGIATLMGVYHQAQENDPTYQQAYQQYLSAKEAVPQARAAFLPSVDIGASGTITRTDNSGVATGNNTAKAAAANVTVTQSVLNFQNIDAFKQAKASVKAAEVTYLAAKQDLIDRVAQAYFGVLQAIDSLRFAESNLDALETQYVTASNLFKAGVSQKSDLSAAKSAFESAYAQETAAWTSLQNARENLSAITGKSYSKIEAFKKINEVRFDYRLSPPDSKSAEASVQQAVNHNLQLMAARYTQQAQMDNIKAQAAGRYPNLALTGSYGYTTTNNNNTAPVGTANQRTAQAVLSLDFPVFKGGLISSQTRQAEADYESAVDATELQYRQTVNNTRSDYFSVLAGINQVVADREAVISARESLKSFQELYKSGAGTIVDVLTATSTLLSAQQQYAQDLYAFIDNQLALKQAEGSLNEKDLARINASLTQAEALPVGNKPPAKRAPILSHHNASQGKK